VKVDDSATNSYGHSLTGSSGKRTTRNDSAGEFKHNPNNNNNNNLFFCYTSTYVSVGVVAKQIFT